MFYAQISYAGKLFRKTQEIYFLLKLVMLENCSEINTRKNKYSVVALALLRPCLRGTSRSWTVIPTAIAEYSLSPKIFAHCIQKLSQIKMPYRVPRVQHLLTTAATAGTTVK